jgi:membrane protein YqaA with SNARE-associated domain
MDFALSAEAGLAGLFVASFLAATLLPGGSEAALLALVALHPEQAMPALLLATVGNTAGGMSTYALGRLLPAGQVPQKSTLAGRHGPPILLLAWTPVIGDALCAAAGWLRLRWLPCLLWMALGKGMRYAVLLAGAAAL